MKTDSENTKSAAGADSLDRIVRIFSGGVDDLVFWSFRYFMGRMTIATCAFAGELAQAWPLLNGHVRGLIRRELEEAFQRDDELRSEGSKYLPLGHDCDRAAWQKVRDAYSANVSHQRPLPADAGTENQNQRDSG